MEEESLLTGSEADTQEGEQSTTETGIPEGFEHVLPKYMAEGRSIEDANTEQAKAYKDLQSKFGGFTGAPEGDYELSFPEGIEGEWIEGDPLMEGFQTWARENQLSQDKFTDLLHLYVKNEHSMLGTDRESEIAALGKDAKSRLQNIDDFAKANLSQDQYQGILAATTTAAGVQAIEALISMTRSAKVPTDMSEATTGVTHSEIKERMADPRYKSDPDFRKETSAMYERLFGKEPKRTTVG